MNLSERLRGSLTGDEPSWIARNWELPLFLVGCVLLAWVATGYERSARQFPFVFLALGAVALSVELLLHALPDRYSAPVQRLTSGLASDIDVGEAEEEDEEEDADSRSGDEAETGIERTEGVAADHKNEDGDDLGLLLKAVLPLVMFAVLAYLVSFLVAVPIYVFTVFYLVGTRNYRNALIVSLVLMAVTYFLFGEVMNVPVTDGELVGDLLS
jgi:hypothetical protein